jgi:ribonuclease P protein component
MSTRHRLNKRTDIARVFAQGRVASDAVLTVRGVVNDRAQCRLAPLVSKRLGGAVVRNRWKRRMREAFRLALPQLPPGIDLAVMPRAGGVPEVKSLVDSLTSLVSQLARRLRPATSSREPKP